MCVDRCCFFDGVGIEGCATIAGGVGVWVFVGIGIGVIDSGC